MKKREKHFLNNTNGTSETLALAGGGSDELSYLETYSNLDDGDLATGNIFDIDEVRVMHQLFGNVAIKKKLFMQILYDFGLNTLQIHKKMPFNWKKELSNQLQKLELKISNNELT